MRRIDSMDGQITLNRYLALFFVCSLILGNASVAWGEKEKIKGGTQKTSSAAAIAAGAGGGPTAASGLSATAASPDVTQLQEELQNILEIHRSIQLQGLSQIREIQRIRDQTEAHQALLKDLAPARNQMGSAVPDVPQGVTVDEFVRIQKIRAIQDQARENRGVLEGLQKGTGEETVAKVATQKKEKKEKKEGKKSKKKKK